MFRILLMFSMVMSVAGCLGGDLAKGGGGDKVPGGDVRKRHPVSQGQVTIVGPEGYCIDPEGIQEGGQGAFVPLGACASITGRLKDGAPSQHFFLSAVVKPMLPDMSAVDVVPAARKALERGSLRTTLADEVLETREENSALIVHSRHQDAPGGLAKDQWRAVFACRNHVVSLTVAGFEGQSGHGETVLLSFLEGMKNANPENKTANTTVRSLFGRLLN